MAKVCQLTGRKTEVVRNRTHSRHAIAMNVALLTRVQADDHHATVTTDDLHIGACRTCNLATLAGLHFNVVDDGANRNLTDFHRVAGLYVGLLRCNHLVTDGQTLWRNDVFHIALTVGDERNEGRAVGIIFDPLDGAFDVPLATLEIDKAIALLVPARDTA